jgi:chromosome segregation ATPase
MRGAFTFLSTALAVASLSGCDGSSPVEPLLRVPAAYVQRVPHDICHGVLNQIAERGFADPHLLAAAAKKNVAILQELETDRATIQALITAFETSLTGLQQLAANLEAQIQAQEAIIDELEELVDNLPGGILDPARAGLLAQLQLLRAQLEAFESQLAGVRSLIASLSEHISVLRAELAPIEAAIARAGC